MVGDKDVKHVLRYWATTIVYHASDSAGFLHLASYGSSSAVPVNDAPDILTAIIPSVVFSAYEAVHAAYF
ncbi:unnamed protein product [Sphagnum jensenii]|uniref:Uncharacterized protein n=1 Tax=Sphagnum jensenii TaxID=128206 RepID=A0ABP0VJG5_9BRYO